MGWLRGFHLYRTKLIKFKHLGTPYSDSGFTRGASPPTDDARGHFRLYHPSQIHREGFVVSALDGTPNDRREAPLWTPSVLTPCPPSADNSGHDQESRLPLTRPTVVSLQCTDGKLLWTDEDNMKKLACAAVMLLLSSSCETATVAQKVEEYNKGAAAYKQGDYSTAREIWRSLADQGVVQAQYNLGLIYTEGRGVPQDFSIGTQWYRKAAEHGHPKAQFNLGNMYENGHGVRQDSSLAAKWYRRAAGHGNARAQYNLGVLFISGKGVAQDDSAAAMWYRKAADQGLAVAQFNLGLMYSKGSGVAQDDTAALT